MWRPGKYRIRVGRDIFAGRYRLESQLGQSTMAEVWLARDLELDRPVALKLLTPDADRARFDREARAAASLAHPNVTRLYDYGEADGRLFMALEYLPGGTLEERLADGRRLTAAETAALAAQLAAGLAHAHERGLVHRDVKPANVLFDEEDRPKLADFGIARITGGDTITETGTVMGTAAYISPEQASGEPAGPPSDVYSFGVLLYRMLTGRLPFESDSPVELAQMHVRAEPPAIELTRPDVPPELAALAMESLAKDPRQRPADGAALAARLGVPAVPGEAAGAAETVVIPPRGRPRRNVRLPLVVGAILLLGAAGVAAGILATRPSSSGSPGTGPAPTRRVQTSSSQPSVPETRTSTSLPTTTARSTTSATTSETKTREPTTSTPPTTPAQTPTTAGATPTASAG